jgi:ABC-type transport system involved in cytochrome c biogenesis permease subunit
MDLAAFSNASLITAFILYNLAFFGFVIALLGKRWKGRNPDQHVTKWSRRAFRTHVVGLLAHIVFFVTRWIYAGHIPTSNMFEFMTFLSMMIFAAFVFVYLLYRKPVIGVFSLPVGIVILAYASVFPWEAQPLIPALNSHWLKIHVTTAALGEAFFAVGFATGLMHLIRTVDFTSAAKTARRERRGVELTILSILMVVGFVIATFAFKWAGYEAVFSQPETVDGQTVVKEVKYTMPPIVKPYQAETVSMVPFLGMERPLFETPGWMKGVDAGRKFNTLLWSALAGLLLYGLLRLALRKPLGLVIQPLLAELDPEDLDEISYRAIAIGFPIYTLGALIFAMIWAEIAWSRFWGWDPKEVWALITWLFYSAYLHLRLSRGWQGKKSSWLSVIGFVIVMFTLVGVNLVIAGLHSYAGV